METKPVGSNAPVFEGDRTRTTHLATPAPKPEISLIVINEALEHRIAVERRRNTRALCWLSAAFLIVVLSLCSMLLSLGMTVSRNARKALDSASATQERTSLALKGYDDRIAEAGKSAAQVAAANEELQRTLGREKADRARERDTLRNDLVAFSKKYGGRNAWVEETLSQMDKLNRKMAELEAASSQDKAKLSEIERLYRELRASGGAATSAQPSTASAVPATDLASTGVADESSSAESPTGPAADELPPGDATNMQAIIYPDGGKYEGQVEGGVKHGLGTYTFANGDRYVGRFSGDMRHGKGTYYYAAGGCYQGEFVQGRRQGYGAYFFANGDVFRGSFKDGLMDGPGVYQYADGVKVNGVWKDDNLVSEN